MPIPTLNQAGEYDDFVIEKGATFDPYVHWATELGIGIDVGSVTDIRMQVRRSKTNPEKLLELTLANSRIERGVATVILGAAANNDAQVATITAAGIVTIDPPVLDEFGFVTTKVQANDILFLNGTDLNDGDGFGHLVVSVESETQCTVVPTSRAGGLFATSLVDEATGNGTLSVSRLGRFQLILTAAETAALTGWNVGFYDIEIQEGAKVVRLLEGIIKLSEEVTK